MPGSIILVLCVILLYIILGNGFAKLANQKTRDNKSRYIMLLLLWLPLLVCSAFEKTSNKNAGVPRRR